MKDFHSVCANVRNICFPYVSQAGFIVRVASGGIPRARKRQNQTPILTLPRITWKTCQIVNYESKKGFLSDGELCLRSPYLTRHF